MCPTLRGWDSWSQSKLLFGDQMDPIGTYRIIAPPILDPYAIKRVPHLEKFGSYIFIQTHSTWVVFIHPLCIQQDPNFWMESLTDGCQNDPRKRQLQCTNLSISLGFTFLKISLPITNIDPPGQRNIYPECDVPVPRIPGTRSFSFFWWYRNRYRKKLLPEKISEPVSEKIGTAKKYWNRYRKNLVQ